MATEQDNEASVRLFTSRCSYAKFRTLSVLVHPVFGHALLPSQRAAIVWLEPREAELLYRCHFTGVDVTDRDSQEWLPRGARYGNGKSYKSRGSGLLNGIKQEVNLSSPSFCEELCLLFFLLF